MAKESETEKQTELGIEPRNDRATGRAATAETGNDISNSKVQGEGAGATGAETPKDVDVIVTKIKAESVTPSGEE
ncbi:hypothetical protein BGZ95_011574, partial [Linnemannia exigua]